MIPEPKLLETQFAVIAADGATGHVLTTNGEVSFSDGSPIYLIFENIHLAREHIKQVQEKNDTIEFVLCDSVYKMVEFWEAPKWK